MGRPSLRRAFCFAPTEVTEGSTEGSTEGTEGSTEVTEGSTEVLKEVSSVN